RPRKPEIRRAPPQEWVMLVLRQAGDIALYRLFDPLPQAVEQRVAAGAKKIAHGLSAAAQRLIDVFALVAMLRVQPAIQLAAERRHVAETRRRLQIEHLDEIII